VPTLVVFVVFFSLCFIIFRLFIFAVSYFVYYLLCFCGVRGYYIITLMTVDLNRIILRPYVSTLMTNWIKLNYALMSSD